MRVRALISLLSVVMFTAVTSQVAAAQPGRPGDDEAIDYHEWSGPRFAEGDFDGVAPGRHGLHITRPIGTIQHTEPKLGTTRTYEYGQWTSPVHRYDFGATQLVASWNAGTPAGTWPQVEAMGGTASGREAGSNATPSVTSLGAMTSNVPDRFEVQTTKPGRATGIELKVPAYAQNLHKGQFPQYGGGGENWCSPTSTEMVAEYWGKKPSDL